jgi:hypothetical protein
MKKIVRPKKDGRTLTQTLEISVASVKPPDGRAAAAATAASPPSADSTYHPTSAHYLTAT